MSNIPDDLWDYAKEEYENIEFGEIRIIANENGKGVDVVTEKRKRFNKTNKEKKTDIQGIYKKG